MLHSPTLQLTWAQVAAMCLGAAKGMQHLHAHSVLHRDLKSGAPQLSNRKPRQRHHCTILRCAICSYLKTSLPVPVAGLVESTQCCIPATRA